MVLSMCLLSMSGADHQLVQSQPDASGCVPIPTRLRSFLECWLGAVGQRVVVAARTDCGNSARKRRAPAEWAVWSAGHGARPALLVSPASYLRRRHRLL
jgi:hypothetical protein